MASAEQAASAGSNRSGRAGPETEHANAPRRRPLCNTRENVQQGRKNVLCLPCPFLGYFPKCLDRGPSILEHLLGGLTGLRSWDVTSLLGRADLPEATPVPLTLLLGMSPPPHGNRMAVSVCPVQAGPMPLC